MPGLIYTFERTGRTNEFASERRTSTDAIIAIAMAAKGHSGISFEELTESSNHAPMIAVVFLDNESLEAFNNRIEALLSQHGVKIRKVQLTEGWQTPQPPLIGAQEA